MAMDRSEPKIWPIGSHIWSVSVYYYEIRSLSFERLCSNSFAFTQPIYYNQINYINEFSIMINFKSSRHLLSLRQSSKIFQRKTTFVGQAKVQANWKINGKTISQPKSKCNKKNYKNISTIVRSNKCDAIHPNSMLNKYFCTNTNKLLYLYWSIHYTLITSERKFR